MVKDSNPTRAESHDIYSLGQGVQGLVLAAETAIGKDPVECVNSKKCMINLRKKIKILQKNKIKNLQNLPRSALIIGGTGFIGINVCKD